MSDQFPPHILEALERMKEEIPADEMPALRAALEQAQKNEITVLQLLTDLFRRTGHNEASAAEAAEAAIAAGRPDLREKLN